jgi:uncharacterized membrane protein HdeD (DUF308 family)
MDTSLFIARLLGPLLLVTGAATLMNQASVRQMATDFLESRPLVYVVGVLTLLGGLVILNTHNVWAGWPVIITIFGWLCVIGGAIRILVPDTVRGLGEAMLKKPNVLTGSGAGQALVGAVLCYFGYLA